MICNKCNHKLPDDSEFCQYCGKKIEKVVAAPMVSVVGEPNIDELTSDEALTNAIPKIQVKNTVDAMETNSKIHPDNEGDADFGLVPEKPIFTPALKSVDGEKKYLNKLRTADGKRIKYFRRGCVSVDGINDMIDIYDIYLPSGQFYKTVYIDMYGSKESTKAPDGFVLNNSAMHSRKSPKKEKIVRTKYCSRCGSEIDRKTKVCTGCGKQYFRGLRLNRFSATVVILSFVIVAVSTFCVIQGINAQEKEKINQCTITDLENQVNDLEKQLKTKQSTMIRLQSQLKNRESTISDLEKEINDLESEMLSNVFKLAFFDNHAALIDSNGSKKYHKYGCEDFDGSYFYIYNIENAEALGYYPCSKCH